jgi:ElaB/YqjD/DUF883 family membrane-anchored ribosome-binding protein
MPPGGTKTPPAALCGLRLNSGDMTMPEAPNAHPTASTGERGSPGGPAPDRPDLADKARDQVDKLAEQASRVATAALHEAREAGERAQEIAGQIRPALLKSLREQPMATLAGAAVVGFLLGALWKR